MKRCSKCNVNVNTDKKHCPLCFNELDGKTDENYVDMFSQKQYINNTNAKIFLVKLFAFISLSISAVLLFINLITDSKVLWSGIVITSIVYLWILIFHTIISKRSFFEKIFFQVVAIYGVIFSTNLVSSEINWFWNYFVASASMATMTVLVFILFIHKRRTEYVGSTFIMALLLTTLSIVAITTKLDTFKVLNNISLVYNAIIILGILFFGHKALLTSISKNFHV